MCWSLTACLVALLPPLVLAPLLILFFGPCVALVPLMLGGVVVVFALPVLMVGILLWGAYSPDDGT